jgi:hypothetical protein
MEIKMKYSVFILAMAALPAAANTEINGMVEAKCVIQTDTSGVYGNPTADKLSTANSDGGVIPIVRYDVAIADYYLAKITHPTGFSSSPALSDTVTWTGDTSVSQTSDAGMSAYDTNKVVYGSTTEFDLTIAGSTWFKTTSTASYGFGKAFPGGNYTAIVVAECIAK